MAAMALVFVGLMFIGGDVSGGSLTGMFKQTFVSVDGKSYGEKDYNNMGRTGLSVAFSFPSTFGPLLQDNFSSEENLRELCHLLKTNNPNAAFLAYRGIIRREAGRLGLTPSTAEIDDAITRILTSTDDAERQELYKSVLTNLHEDAMYLPLTYECNKALYTSALHGVHFGTDQYDVPFADMYFE